MGVRFRWRWGLGKAPFRVNLTKRGLSSLSIGKPGFTFNLPIFRRGKPRTTVSIPGTGLSGQFEASKARVRTARINADVSRTDDIDELGRRALRHIDNLSLAANDDSTQQRIADTKSAYERAPTRENLDQLFLLMADLTRDPALVASSDKLIADLMRDPALVTSAPSGQTNEEMTVKSGARAMKRALVRGILGSLKR